ASSVLPVRRTISNRATKRGTSAWKYPAETRLEVRHPIAKRLGAVGQRRVHGRDDGNGEVSQGMLFDIGFADGVTPVLALPEHAVPSGLLAV
ncbi:MAG: hypothetical protein OEW19_05665, partial [Acidobacteriota bacterium]|nr:hypothetical protein [Acidobacteriota bacterium]